MKKTNVFTRLINSSLLLVSVSGFVLLQSCSSSGGGAPADANPNGYYDAGSAAVKLSDDTTDLAISDLQGMVSGNRFMLTSEAETILYDGTITDITGTAFTGTVNIYEDGVLLAGTTTVAGTITTASSITGTFTGSGAGNGTFSLTYSLHNTASDASRLVNEWDGTINGVSDATLLDITNVGAMTLLADYSSIIPVLAGCTLNPTSTALPISNVNVYALTITLSTCTNSAVDGDYTGFATTTTVANDELIIAYSNASFSASGILPVF